MQPHHETLLAHAVAILFITAFALAVVGTIIAFTKEDKP